MRRRQDVRESDLLELFCDHESVFVLADNGKSVLIAGLPDNDYGIELSVAWANLGNRKPFAKLVLGLDIADFVKDAQGDTQAVERCRTRQIGRGGLEVS